MDAQRLKVRERNITARERALDAREASLREDKKVHERASAVHREGIASKEEELVRRGAEVDTKRALAAKRMERADSILQSAKARRSGRRVALAEAAWLYRADDGEVHGPFLSKKVRDFSVLDARCAFEAAAAVHDATRFFFSGSCSITHSNTCPSPPLPSPPCPPTNTHVCPSRCAPLAALRCYSGGVAATFVMKSKSRGLMNPVRARVVPVNQSDLASPTS